MSKESNIEKSSAMGNATFLDFYSSIYFPRLIWPTINKYLAKCQAVKKISPIQGKDGIYKFNISMDGIQSLFSVHIAVDPKPTQPYATFEMIIDNRFSVNTQTGKYKDTSKWIGDVLGDKIYSKIVNILAVLDPI